VGKLNAHCTFKNHFDAILQRQCLSSFFSLTL
jgi:hypothetical protein